jgi:S-formylglutathione hydrolase FrmB
VRARRLAGWALATLAFLGACAGTADAKSYFGAKVVSEQSLDDDRVELTISTPAFTDPTRVQVFLPAGYDEHPKRRWPVTYYLHGAQGDETRFNAWYGDLIKDFRSIVVAPAGGILGFYSDWFNGGAGGPPMYETYDIDQLIPLIDDRFRTYGDRAHRALIGESMGGYGVMTYAARHPDLFAAAASLSGAVDSNYPPAIALISAGSVAQEGAPPDGIYGPRSADEIRWHGHNPADLAENLRGVDLQVRTAEGIPDPAIETPGEGTATDCTLERGIFDMSTDLHQSLLAYGIPHVWTDYGPGCHTVPNFRREFTDALPGLEDAFARPQRKPRTFSYRSIEPRFEIWGWRVRADPKRALEFLALRNVGRHGLTAVGSGTTAITTPPIFRRAERVAVRTDGQTKSVAPDRHGRLHLTVDLGSPHPNQEDTDPSRAAGDGAAGYFTHRRLVFVIKRRPARED